MKRILLCGLSLLMDSVGYAEDISIRYNGSSAKVKQTATDSVKVTVDGARVSIESLYKDHKITLLLKGKSDDGQLLLKAAGKAKIMFFQHTQIVFSFANVERKIETAEQIDRRFRRFPRFSVGEVKKCLQYYL